MLDNPVWSALATCQAGVAAGDGVARRYPHDVTPFVGVAAHDVSARDHVRALVPVGERVVFLGVAPRFDDDWRVERVDDVLQWVADRPPPGGASMLPIETLAERDRSAMHALTCAVYPDFFRARTALLGTYLGVRVGDALAAMGGERMKLDGYQELSTLCSRPELRRHGYGTAILDALVRRTVARGEAAFAHTVIANDAPQRVVRALGFVHRATLTMWTVRRVA